MPLYSECRGTHSALGVQRAVEDGYKRWEHACPQAYAGGRVQGISSRQFLQQRPGVLQVGGVKAFGEPAVDRG